MPPKKAASEIERIAIDEDIEFLKGMMTSRSGQYTCKDVITSKYQEMRRVRLQEAEERANKHRNDDALIYLEDACDDNDEEETEEYIEHLGKGKRKHRRLKKTGVTIHIPYDIMKKDRIVSNYTRNKISST